MDRFRPLVASLARRILNNRQDAAEATQDILVALWRNAGRYDPERGSEATFVSVLTRRRLIDRLRSGGRRPKPVGLEAAGAVGDDGGIRRVEWRDEAARAERELAALRPAERMAIRLAVMEGWTHVCVAEHLGLPLGTVKTHIRRGLQRLGAALAPA